MGAARKLQQEIDQVMKKVKEGLASFDEIHEKVREHCWLGEPVCVSPVSKPTRILACAMRKPEHSATRAAFCF